MTPAKGPRPTATTNISANTISLMARQASISRRVGCTIHCGQILLALRIENGQFDLQTIAVKYIRSFELLGKSARVDLAQPYQFGHWSGLLNGVQAATDRSGFADTSVRFAVNLFGAPPLKGKKFAEYRATKADSETVVGIGLGLLLPTGQYYNFFGNLLTNDHRLRPPHSATTQIYTHEAPPHT